MKTLIKQSFVVVVLFATLTSYASSVDPLVKVKESENKVFTLILSDLNLQEVRIFIKDKNGEILYKEGLKITSGCIKQYDVKALPTGDYILEIENSQIIKSMPFEVRKSNVLFLRSEETEVFKPFVRQRGKMIDVMFKASGDVPTKVIIYDENGRILKKNKTSSGIDIERIYDFSLLPKGTYQISFQRGDREFRKEIVL